MSITLPGYGSGQTVTDGYVDLVDNWWVIALIVLGIIVVGGLVWLGISRSGGGPKTTPERSGRSGGARDSDAGNTTPVDQPETEDTRPRAAVVVNPTKFDDNNTDKPRAEIASICAAHGWAEPLWLETTEEDPGYGQAREALGQGVDLVCALGGDGTVRTVGSALVDSGVPMGLLPAGTGNLLARNLSLPVSSLSQGTKVALTGVDTAIDTGTLALRRPHGDADDGDAAPPVDPDTIEEHPPTPGHGEGEVEEHVFLVMAGLGFDAEVMANVPGKLKKRVGWAAYVVTGLKGLKGRQFKVDVIIDEGGTRLHRRVRSVMVGNVGKLQGGVNLVPQAKADDGILDLVLLSPEGLVGWGAVVTRLVTRSSRGHQRVDYYTARTLEVSADAPVQIQLDGDTLGEATAMSVAVNPGSLIVRRPAN